MGNAVFNPGMAGRLTRVGHSGPTAYADDVVPYPWHHRGHPAELPRRDDAFGNDIGASR